MKLTIEKQDSILKAIKAEYTPAEMIILRYAMRRFAEDEDVNETDRAIMQQMLEVVQGEESEDEQ